MDGWEMIRSAAADRRSGAAEIAERAAEGISLLSSQRDVTRAVRHLIRAHPAMAPLRRLGAAVIKARDHRSAAARFADAVREESEGIARAAARVIPRRAVVLTHSASSHVLAALVANRRRVVRVICTTSLPGGEGRPFARRLERAGFSTEVVSDAAIASACARAGVALVGADAVTENAAINKVGTMLVALAAHHAEIGFYVVAGTSKLLPARIWAGIEAPLYEPTPLRLVDAVVTERGPLGTAAIRRAIGRLEIPRAVSAPTRRRSV